MASMSHLILSPSLHKLWPNNSKHSLIPLTASCPAGFGGAGKTFNGENTPFLLTAECARSRVASLNNILHFQLVLSAFAMGSSSPQGGADPTEADLDDGLLFRNWDCPGCPPPIFDLPPPPRPPWLDDLVRTLDPR